MTVRGIGYRFSSAKPQKSEAIAPAYKVQQQPFATFAPLAVSDVLEPQKSVAPY